MHKHVPTLTQPCTPHSQWHKHSNAHTYTFPQTQRSPATHTHSHPLTFTHTFVYEKEQSIFFNRIYVYVTVLRKEHFFSSTWGCHKVCSAVLSHLFFKSCQNDSVRCPHPFPEPSPRALYALSHTSLFVALMPTQGSKTPGDFHWYPALYLTKRRWVTNYFSFTE